MNTGGTSIYSPQYGAQPVRVEEAPRFAVESRYTFQDLLTLNQLVGKTTRRVVTLPTRILCAVLGGWMLMFTGLQLWLGSIAVITPISLLMGLFLIALSVFYHHINAWQSKRLMVKFDGTARFDFLAESFTERTSVGVTSHPYGAIYAAYHFKNRFFVFLDKKHSYILPEAEFVQGLLAEFKPFLEQKCGKKVIDIR